MSWFKEKENLYKFLVIFGVVMCVLPITMQVISDYRLRDNQTIIFTDLNGNSIFNKYYPGDRNFGVMIFHGMGNDQTSFDLYTSQFSQQGFHVFGTDFSGHGRSSGLIPSGNNSANELALQVLRAKTEFKEVSGLEDSEIFMLGHSMGARGVMKSTTSPCSFIFTNFSLFAFRTDGYSANKYPLIGIDSLFLPVDIVTPPSPVADSYVIIDSLTFFLISLTMFKNNTSLSCVIILKSELLLVLYSVLFPLIIKSSGFNSNFAALCG